MYFTALPKVSKTKCLFSHFIGNLGETESSIKKNLIPAITGRNDPADEKQSLVSLPVRDGGLSIVDPEDRVEELNWSRQMAARLDKDDDAEAQQSLIVNQRKKSEQIEEGICFVRKTR